MWVQDGRTWVRLMAGAIRGPSRANWALQAEAGRITEHRVLLG